MVLTKEKCFHWFGNGFPSSVDVDIGAGDCGNSLPNFTNEGLHEVDKSPPGN